MACMTKSSNCCWVISKSVLQSGHTFFIDTPGQERDQQLFLTYSALGENVEKFCQDFTDSQTKAETCSSHEEESLKLRWQIGITHRVYSI